MCEVIKQAVEGVGGTIFSERKRGTFQEIVVELGKGDFLFSEKNKLGDACVYEVENLSTYRSTLLVGSEQIKQFVENNK